MLQPELVTRPRPKPIGIFMRQHGVTIESLAAVVGCSPQWISLVVNGRREPSRRLRASLSLALGVPVEDLF